MPYRPKPDLSLSRLRSAISNGTYTLPDVDHRSAWMRRLKDLITDMTYDLGGEGKLSTAEKILIRRACMLTLQVEWMETNWARKNDGEATSRQLLSYGRAVNTLRRCLESLGLEMRRPIRDVTAKKMTAEEAREELLRRGIPLTGLFDPPAPVQNPSTAEHFRNC